MKIYDTNYDPDTFGRIRMGFITEMFLNFDGFLKPEIGDHLRISCLFKGVVRDVYTVVISNVLNCLDEPETVMVQIETINKYVLEVPKGNIENKDIDFLEGKLAPNFPTYH